MIVQELGKLFDKLYLPSGMPAIGNKHHPLRNVSGCESLLSWSSNRFLGSDIQAVFPGINVASLVKYIARRCGKPLDNLKIHTLVSFKMNALVDSDIRVQKAHYICLRI